MTNDRGIERVLERWLTEGSARMPDGLVERMVGRIEAVPQSRFARLRTTAVTFAFNRNGRHVAAALAMVVFVAVVGGTVLSRVPAVGVLASPSPSVVPSASPSTGPSAAVHAVVDLAQLQATWTSSGTRPLPYHADRNGTVDFPAEIVFGPRTMKVVAIGDDWLSSLAFVGSDQFEITSQTGPNPMYAKCNIGDLGTYRFSLAATGSTLTLTPVSDACPSRAAVLTGDWDHTNLGPLAPGRRVATPFRPFGGGTTGSLSYSVPTGWQEDAESPTEFALSRPDPTVLTWIAVLSNVIPSTEDKNCGGPAAPAVGRTPVEVAEWLTTLTGLVVTKPVPVTIGGLDGVMVDVSLARSWNEPCTSFPQRGTNVSTFVGASSGDVGPIVDGETRGRYLLLDRGDGQTLLIDIEAQDAATWPAVLAAANPVVNSFAFNR